MKEKFSPESGKSKNEKILLSKDDIPSTQWDSIEEGSVLRNLFYGHVKKENFNNYNEYKYKPVPDCYTSDWDSLSDAEKDELVEKQQKGSNWEEYGRLDTYWGSQDREKLRDDLEKLSREYKKFLEKEIENVDFEVFSDWSDGGKVIKVSDSRLPEYEFSESFNLIFPDGQSRTFGGGCSVQESTPDSLVVTQNISSQYSNETEITVIGVDPEGKTRIGKTSFFTNVLHQEDGDGEDLSDWSEGDIPGRGILVKTRKGNFVFVESGRWSINDFVWNSSDKDRDTIKAKGSCLDYEIRRIGGGSKNDCDVIIDSLREGGPESYSGVVSVDDELKSKIISYLNGVGVSDVKEGDVSIYHP